MPLSVSTPLARSESVVFAELGDQVVMLDTKAGRYYELDAVGTRVWELLEGRLSMAGLRDALTAEFDVDEETCLNDLSGFLEELAALGLVAAALDGAEGG